jgi:hypothetical protein
LWSKPYRLRVRDGKLSLVLARRSGENPAELPLIIMANDPTQSPSYIVSDACISFTEALLSYRSSVVTVDDANSIGQDLFAWFKNVGAITDDNALLAKRSVDLGKLTLQRNSVETVDETVELIHDTYTHYSST